MTSRIQNNGGKCIIFHKWPIIPLRHNFAYLIPQVVVVVPLQALAITKQEKMFKDIQKLILTPIEIALNDFGQNYGTFIKTKCPLALNIFFAQQYFRPTVVHSTEVQQAVNLEPKCKVLCHNEIICRRHLCSNLQHVLTLSKGITAE